MKKKAIALMLALLMFGLCACDADYDDDDDDDDGNRGNKSSYSQKADDVDLFEYSINSGGIRITGYKGSGKRIVFPEKIENRTVYEIYDGAFGGMTELEEIVFPSGVKELGRTDFTSCTSLKRIELPGVERFNYDDDEYFPPSVKELIIPSLKYRSSFSDEDPFDLEELEVSGLVSLDYLDISGATHLKSGPEHCIPIKEVKLSKELEYYYEDFAWGITDLFSADSDRYWGGATKITKENRADVYCGFFGVDEIIVNGVKYSR